MLRRKTARRLAIWLLAFTFLPLMLMAGAAMAEGKILTDGIDPMIQASDCTLPTTREDGSPLLVSDIQYLDFFLTQDLNAPDPDPSASDLALGCHAEFDLSTMAYGQWYLFWKTVDTQMQVSKRSEVVPFVWKVKDAPPSSPGNVTLGPAQ